MPQIAHLRRLLQELFAAQRLAVLATQGGGQPYASLVAFAASEDLKHLLFATARTTRKYANLVSADGKAALLIDSRTNQEDDFHRAMAVTATGVAATVEDDQRPRWLPLYLARHPHLEDFVTSPTCALLRLKVDCYYIVTHFQRVMELRPA